MRARRRRSCVFSLPLRRSRPPAFGGVQRKFSEDHDEDGRLVHYSMMKGPRVVVLCGWDGGGGREREPPRHEPRSSKRPGVVSKAGAWPGLGPHAGRPASRVRPVRAFLQHERAPRLAADTRHARARAGRTARPCSGSLWQVAARAPAPGLSRTPPPDDAGGQFGLPRGELSTDSSSRSPAVGSSLRSVGPPACSSLGSVRRVRTARARRTAKTHALPA